MQELNDILLKQKSTLYAGHLIIGGTDRNYHHLVFNPRLGHLFFWPYLFRRFLDDF